MICTCRLDWQVQTLLVEKLETLGHPLATYPNLISSRPHTSVRTSNFRSPLLMQYLIVVTSTLHFSLSLVRCSVSKVVYLD